METPEGGCHIVLSNGLWLQFKDADSDGNILVSFKDYFGYTTAAELKAVAEYLSPGPAVVDEAHVGEQTVAAELPYAQTP